MQTRSKIRLDAIEQIRRTLEALPQHHDEEVTKKQAIRMLLPNIEAIRTKGYGLAVIAGFLSENGIPITVPYLKTLLCPRRHDAQGKKEPKRKVRQQVRQTAPRETADHAGIGARSKRPDVEVTPRVTKVDVPGKSPARPEPNDGDARRDARAGAAVPAPERRSMFVPREDSDEI